MDFLTPTTLIVAFGIGTGIALLEMLILWPMLPKTGGIFERHPSEAKEIFREYKEGRLSWEEAAPLIMGADYKFAQEIYYTETLAYLNTVVPNPKEFLKKLKSYKKLLTSGKYTLEEMGDIKRNFFSPEDARHLRIVYDLCPHQALEDILRGGLR